MDTNQDAPPDGYISASDAPPDGYDSSPTSNMDQFKSAMSEGTKKALLNPLQAIKQHVLNIGKGVEATASLPYRAAGAGIDAATGIPGFAKNVDVFPQLGAASPSFQTMGGNALGAVGGEVAGQAIPAAIQSTVNGLGNAVDTARKPMQWLDGLRRAIASGESAQALADTSRLAVEEAKLGVSQAQAKAINAAGDAQKTLGTSDAPLSIGMNIRSGYDSTVGGAKALEQKLYGKLPSIELPINEVKNITTNILADIGKVDKAFQPSGKFIEQVSALANLEKNPSLQAINTMRSQIADKMVNGEGVEKMYAGRIWSAFNKDIAAGEGVTGPLGEVLDNHLQTTYAQAKKVGQAIRELENNPLIQKLQKAPLSDLPDVIFKNGRAEDVLTARAAIGEEAYTQALKAHTNELLTSPKLGKMLADNPEFFKSAYTSDQLSTLKGVSKLQDAVGASKLAVNQARNTSVLHQKLAQQAGVSAADAARRLGRLGTAGKVITGVALTDVIGHWALGKMFGGH